MDTQEHLSDQREKIDEIDQKILQLLKERNQVAQDVVRKKVDKQLPIFVAEREKAKTRHFRERAEALDLDPEWAEDFLRLIMYSSRASQSSEPFQRSIPAPNRILLDGTGGGICGLTSV